MELNRALRLGLLTFALLLLSSCASYRAARARDLGECFRGGVALGLGLYAEVEATSLVEPAAGFADVTLTPKLAWSWDPRHPSPTGTLRTASFPTMLVGWPFYGYGEHQQGYGDTHPYLRGALSPWILMGNHHIEGRTTGLLHLDAWIPNPRIDPDAYTSTEAKGSDSNQQVSEDTSGNEPERSLVQQHGWFGVSTTLVVVRVDLGINPVELVDFFVGLFMPD